MKSQSSRKVNSKFKAQKQNPSSEVQVSYDAQGRLLFYGTELLSAVQKKAGRSLKLQQPVYFYSAEQLKQRAHYFMKELQRRWPQDCSVHYALKANSHPQLLKILKGQGLGVDAVSFGEIKRAMQAGFKPGQILFSGVGKTEVELTQAVRTQIFQLNVESLPELEKLGKITARLKKQVRVGLRVNPGVNPKTHPYITTGFRENKFGLDPSHLPGAVELFRRYKNLSYQGLSLHIGSQLLDFSALAEGVQITRQMDQDLERQGLVSSILDVGGGIGIDYGNNSEVGDHAILEQFLKVVGDALKGFKKRIGLEPGRFLVGRAGGLLVEVQYIKATPYKKFVIVNSGMNHLLRPALYQAEHRIFPLRPSAPTSSVMEVMDVVGPICESSDVIARNRSMPPLKSGDYLAIMDAGAYGFSMASHYNSFPLPQEIFV